jgi:hypothetical protein
MEQAERELPTVAIERTRFIVDVYQNELRQKGNEKNAIAFECLDYKGTHYELEYDKSRKNIPEIFNWDSKDVVKVTIPQKVELDPEGMAKKYGFDLQSIHCKSDFEIMVDQMKYEERVIKGFLPTIDVAGETYIVDLSRKSLLLKENPFLTIDLDSMHIVPRAGYEFLYDPTEKKVLELDASKTEITKDTLLVSVPDEMKLDPVWVAKRCNLDLNDFLMKSPFHELKAKVAPAQDTWLAEILKQDSTPLIKKNSGPEINNGKGGRYL